MYNMGFYEPLRYIHRKQSAWYCGYKLLRATPPPPSLTCLDTPTETARLGEAQCATGLEWL